VNVWLIYSSILVYIIYNMHVYDVPSQCRVLFYINYILDAISCAWVGFRVSLSTKTIRSYILYTVYPVVYIILFLYMRTCLLYGMSLPRRKTSNLLMRVITNIPGDYFIIEHYIFMYNKIKMFLKKSWTWLLVVKNNS